MNERMIGRSITMYKYYRGETFTKGGTNLSMVKFTTITTTTTIINNNTKD